MALDLLTVPCLSDNYAYIVHDRASGQVAVVDAPEAGPILATLKARGWPLHQILLTHHHDDHIQAVGALVAATGAKVYGAKADAHRLPPLDHALAPNESFLIGTEKVDVIEVSGHTIGHIAFSMPASQLAFTGDSLMAAGCGRLFEGSAEVMYHSLARLNALAPETRIASGHDYLGGNLRFAAHLEPENPDIKLRIETVDRMRREGRLPMPWTLAEERKTNPFLRAHLPALKAAVGLTDAPDIAVFAAIRALKDKF